VFLSQAAFAGSSSKGLTGLGTTTLLQVAPVSTYSQSHPAYNHYRHCQACDLTQRRERNRSYDSACKSPEDFRLEFDELRGSSKLIINSLEPSTALWAHVLTNDLMPEGHWNLELNCSSACPRKPLPECHRAS
jgi:hypothetical protein